MKRTLSSCRYQVCSVKMSDISQFINCRLESYVSGKYCSIFRYFKFKDETTDLTLWDVYRNHNDNYFDSFGLFYNSRHVFGLKTEVDNNDCYCDNYVTVFNTSKYLKMIRKVVQMEAKEMLQNELQRISNYNFSRNIVERAKEIGVVKVKNHFGKEFFINGIGAIDNKINNDIIRFFRTYDKSFNSHFDETAGTILPFITLCKFDARTYMVMASSRYIPGRMENALVNIETHADLYVYIFGRNSGRYIAELDNILKSREVNSRNDVIYSVNSIGTDSNTDISCINMSKRKMSSLIYSDGELDKIRQHLDQFLHGKEFYHEKELSYKTGILMYGKPGTGKSSLVKAIATEYHRGIISIDVSNISNIDFARLTMMINNEQDEQYIILFEDIDTLYLNREESDKHDKNYNDIINKLLQFLDSNQSPTDVIFIATTNHVDRLDEALIRDGRFDLRLEIGELNENDIVKFLSTFDLDTSLKGEIVKEYTEQVGHKVSKYNQSKLQNIILRHIKNNKIEEQKKEPVTISVVADDLPELADFNLSEYFFVKVNASGHKIIFLHDTEAGTTKRVSKLFVKENPNIPMINISDFR